MKKQFTTGEVIDELLRNHKAKFTEVNGDTTAYIDTYGRVVFAQYDMYKSTVITIDDKNKNWTRID